MRAPVRKLARTVLPPEMFPAVTSPVTESVDNAPTEVMFGCAAVVTVPAVIAAVAVPVIEPGTIKLATVSVLLLATYDIAVSIPNAVLMPALETNTG